MSGENLEHSIERIVVALDNSPGSLTAFREAVNLAAGFQAKVVGLFVEDINLVRLAQMSFAQEVGRFSATRRRLDIQYVERQFRGQASQIRQALVVLAGQAGVSWTFRSVRGVVAQEILRAASDADLIVLGRVGLSPLGRKRIGSTARAVLRQSPRLALVLHSGNRPDGPTIILYDGSAVAQRALAFAAQMVSNKNGPVTVLLLADGADEVERLRHEAEERLNSYGLAAQFMWHADMGSQSLIGKIQNNGCRMVTVPSNGSRLNSEIILSLLEGLECPVLLVR